MNDSVWTDTHCHLDMIEDEPSSVLQRAAQEGVRSVVTIGTDISSSRKAVELASRHDQVWAVVGMHPHDAKFLDDTALGEIDRLSGDPKVVGIGEIGLDYFRDHSPRDQQREAFRKQLHLANRLSKAVVIHMRDAHDDVFSILSEETPARLVFHCFSGGPVEVRRALDLGGFISFAGNVSYKNADDLRRSAKEVPLEKLLIETDSPFLAPLPHRGKPNEPALVAKVGRFLAELLSVHVDELAAATTANAGRAFGI
jgi:TatD DNase family protein